MSHIRLHLPLTTAGFQRLAQPTQRRVQLPFIDQAVNKL
jgi:hypothetical protein